MEELEEGRILPPTLKGLDNVFEIETVYFNLFMLCKMEACTFPVYLPS